jgi:hypothetical protein
VTAQLERVVKAAVEGDEERVCSVKTVVAELSGALLVEEVRLAHFQGVGQKDHGRSYVAVAALRDRCPDSSEGVFQALSMIKSVVLPQETPCLRSGLRRSGIGGSDW